jgi:hypothetical protein
MICATSPAAECGMALPEDLLFYDSFLLSRAKMGSL